MNILNTYLQEAFLIESNFFQDDRGGFLKVFNTDIPLLREYAVKQINYVVSVEKHTLRGLHYQTGNKAESKIFRVLRGAAQIAFVDIRTGSSTYLQAITVVLNHPKQAVVIPRGFATGYCTLLDHTEMIYLSDNDYDVSTEAGLLWNDPRVNIDWLGKIPVLSEKDKKWELLE